MLEDLAYFNTKIKVDGTNKLRRKEAIFDQIINQLPPNSDTYCIKHNKKKDIFTVKRDVKRRPALRRKYNSSITLSPTGDKFYQRYDYKRYLFKYNPYYQCKNQIFISDTVNDTFIANAGDYHQVINDTYQRYGRGRPDPNPFMLEYYWTIKPDHKNVACNMTTFVDLTPAECKLIAFIQTDTPGKVQVNTTISIFAAHRTVRGYSGILRQANHIRRIKMPNKYLTKLRAKYKDFKLTEFDQHAFPPTLTYSYWLMNDLHTYPHYSWPKFWFGIFGP